MFDIDYEYVRTNNNNNERSTILPLNPAAFRTKSILDGMTDERDPSTVMYMISRHVKFGLMTLKIQKQS
jgi:hypothetical protein